MAKPILKALIGMPKPMYRYNLSAATEIRKHVNLPLIVVGGNHRLADINEIVCLGDCYHVSMSRPFIIETDIVNKIKLGKSTSSNCIMCNYCMIVGEEKPLKCYYGRMPKTKMENK